MRNRNATGAREVATASGWPAADGYSSARHRISGRRPSPNGSFEKASLQTVEMSRALDRPRPGSDRIARNRLSRPREIASTEREQITETAGGGDCCSPRAGACMQITAGRASSHGSAAQLARYVVRRPGHRTAKLGYVFAAVAGGGTGSEYSGATADDAVAALRAAEAVSAAIPALGGVDARTPA